MSNSLFNTRISMKSWGTTLKICLAIFHSPLQQKYQKLSNALLQLGNNQILEGIGSGSSLSMLGWLLVQAEFKLRRHSVTTTAARRQHELLSTE